MLKFLPSYPALLIVFSAFLWGLDGLLFRPHLREISVFLVVFIEHLLSALVLLPFFVLRRWQWVKLAWRTLGRRGVFSLLWVVLFGGIIGTVAITQAFFLVDFQGQVPVNFSIIVLLQKLQPVFALILARVFLKETLPTRFWFLAVLALMGSFLLAFPDYFLSLNPTNIPMPVSLWGDTLLVPLGLPAFPMDTNGTWAAALAFLAAFAWGSSTVASRDLVTRIAFPEATFFRFVFTSILILPLVLIFTPQVSGAINSITPVQWLIFVGVLFTSGAVALFLYYAGLRRTRASVSTICELTLPFTMLLGEYLLYGRTLTSLQWLGAGLLLFAVLKISLYQKSGASA